MGAKKQFKGFRKFIAEYEPWVNNLPDRPPEECGFYRVPHEGSGSGFDPACGGGCEDGGKCSKLVPHGEMGGDGEFVMTFECVCEKQKGPKKKVPEKKGPGKVET
jgi:hypothetical protein